MFADTPEPPYYAVIFTNQLNEDATGYDAMAEDMLARALARDGCLGAESTRDGNGFGITVSYWQTLADARAWKEDPVHLRAQQLGRDRWYQRYAVRVARVDRAY